MKTSGAFYSGTSGLMLPVPNKSHYPEEFRNKSRLTYYGSLFNSIEINSSFYKIPQAKTLENWSAMVPDNFRFSLKLFRDLTHQKALKYVRADLDRFLVAASGIGGKKGCLLLQLPGGSSVDCYEQLGSLLSDISAHPLAKGWKLSVELRNNSWYISETWELLNDYQAAIVFQDIPKSITPRVKLKSKWIYLRYHGPTGNYRGSYSPDRLKADAIQIRGWREEGKTVFAYFNNTLGSAIPNLNDLRQFTIASPR